MCFADLLWSSATQLLNNLPGAYPKFVTPTISNGRVFVPSWSTTTNAGYLNVLLPDLIYYISHSLKLSYNKFLS